MNFLGLKNKNIEDFQNYLWKRWLKSWKSFLYVVKYSEISAADYNYALPTVQNTHSIYYWLE